MSPETIQCRAGSSVAGVIIIQACRLQEVQGNRWQTLHELAGSDGADDQGQEYDEHEEIEYSEANDPALTQFGLLERVDRRADLTTTCLLDIESKIGWTWDHTWVEARIT